MVANVVKLWPYTNKGESNGTKEEDGGLVDIIIFSGPNFKNLKWSKFFHEIFPLFQLFFCFNLIFIFQVQLSELLFDYFFFCLSFVIYLHLLVGINKPELSQLHK